MNVLHKRTLSALVALIAASGCSDDGIQGQDWGAICSPGTHVTRSGIDYCVYDQDLIIEGFDCPSMAPHRHDVTGATATACSRREFPPAQDVEDVLGPWTPPPTGGVDAGPVGPINPIEPDMNDAVDFGLPPGDMDAGPSPADMGVDMGQPDTCQRDVDCAPQQSCEVGPSGARKCVSSVGQSCGYAYPGAPAGQEVKVGDTVLVIDWECDVSRCCGDGTLIAHCPEMGGDYVCYEGANGYLDCVGVGSGLADSVSRPERRRRGSVRVLAGRSRLR